MRAVQSLGLLRFPGDTPAVVDGSFGPDTADRVRNFQMQWGLGTDGVVGVHVVVPRDGAGHLAARHAGRHDGRQLAVLAAQYLLRRTAHPSLRTGRSVP